MLGKTYLFFALFILYINIENISSACIEGTNCPYGQGVCRANVCVCLKGYETFITQDTTTPVYCNYGLTSRWVPFFLELFLPTIGLFYLGRYFHAFIKLALFFPIMLNRSNVYTFWGLLFSIIYLVDLVCLFFGVYSDGNGYALI